MEIDLRELQALHARYAREHFVIDLESQVRALPAPLLLAHEPPADVSPARRAWNARWRLGRGAFMVAGGAVICAALGMGLAHVWPMVHKAHAQAPVGHSQNEAIASGANSPADTSTPAVSAAALTSKDLLTDSGRANWSTAVDPAALLRQSLQARESAATNPLTATRGSDEQKALASPLRQHVTKDAPAAASAPAPVKTTPVAGAPAVEPPATAKDVQPAPRPVVRHVVRAHAAPPRPEQQASGEAAKPAAPPAQRSGDVQLF
jgi:hypothetical protein